MTESTDPYPHRAEAVRLLRLQGRDEEAEAILSVTTVWEPEYKSVDQWMALGTYLVGVRPSEVD